MLKVFSSTVLPRPSKNGLKKKMHPGKGLKAFVKPFSQAVTKD
jgi:hypothetical protein